MKEKEAVNHAVGYHRTATRALARLADGDEDPETLHRLRTHLRRLQAYADLIGETEQARRIADTVSRVSRLRTLQVFADYLEEHHASKRDYKKVVRLTDTVRKTLRRRGVYSDLQACLQTTRIKALTVPVEWMSMHVEECRGTHAVALRQLLQKADRKPKRKTLHAIRLQLKAIRYQEEWAANQPYAKANLVALVKRSLTVLGRYEELAEFRQLSKKLGLASHRMLVKAWRRARKRARAVPGRLEPILEQLISASMRHRYGIDAAPSPPKSMSESGMTPPASSA